MCVCPSKFITQTYTHHTIYTPILCLSLSNGVKREKMLSMQQKLRVHAQRDTSQELELKRNSTVRPAARQGNMAFFSFVLPSPIPPLAKPKHPT